MGRGKGSPRAKSSGRCSATTSGRVQTDQNDGQSLQKQVGCFYALRIKGIGSASCNVWRHLHYDWPHFLVQYLLRLESHPPVPRRTSEACKGYLRPKTGREGVLFRKPRSSN